MTPTELHAWVVAQWQAKLDVARAATPGPWDRTFNGLHMNGSGTARIAPITGGPAVVNGFFLNGADPDHIVVFNPAFAIAVCEAALRRLERHSAMPSGLCYAHFDDTKWLECLIALDDAAPFAGQPDFPEELKRP